MRARGAILAAAVLVLAASCAAPATEAAPSTGRTVEIEMKEFSFSPSAITLRAGERVILRVKNGGTTEHDLMAGRDPKPSEGYHEDLFADLEVRMTGGAPGHGAAHRGVGLLLATARSGAVAFTVPDRPGHYEFGCFVPGHYELGMKGTLIIV